MFVVNSLIGLDGLRTLLSGTTGAAYAGALLGAIGGLSLVVIAIYFQTAR